MSARAGTSRVRVGMVVDLDMVDINSSQLAWKETQKCSEL